MTGGLLAGLLALLTGLAVPSAFTRAAWGGWLDADHDCQDTRTEVLITESRIPATLSRDGCTVMRGRWHDPYTGATFTRPQDLDVDHVIPLAYAHRHGGAAWSRARKQAYANDLADPRHLVAVDKRANRAKGDRGPADWLPRLEDCAAYRAAWLAIATRWKLRLDRRDRTALATCRLQPVPVRKPRTKDKS